MRPASIALACACLSVTAAPARGQDTAPATQPAPPIDPSDLAPKWTFRFEPAAWYVAPGGKLSLPSSGGGQRVRMERLDLDNPRLSPYVQGDVRLDRWHVLFSGFSFQANIDASPAEESSQIGNVPFNQGDLMKSRMDFESFELEAGYRFIQQPVEFKDGVLPLFLGIDGLLGARVYDTTVNVQHVGGPETESTHEFFGEAVIGLRADLQIYKEFTIEVQTTLGAMPTSRSAYSWDVQVRGMYRPIDNLGLMFGYRQFLYDLDDGNGDSGYHYRGGMAGLFGGIELRF